MFDPSYRSATQYFPSEQNWGTLTYAPVTTASGGGGGTTIINNNNVYNGILTVSASGSSISSGSLVFANSNDFTFGMSGGTITLSYNNTATASNYFFSNANGITFGTAGSTVTASHNGLTNSAAFIGSAYTSHTHSQYVNTSQSSLFQHTSATSAITASALNTSQSSLFQHTSATSAITSAALHTSSPRIQGIIGSNTTYTSGSVSLRDLNGISFQSTTGQAFQITHALQYTSNTSAITSNALNTSQSSLFQHTSGMSDYLGTGYTTHTHSQYINTSNSSLFRHTSADSQLQFTSQMSDYLDTGYTTHTHPGGVVAAEAGNGSFSFNTLSFSNVNGVSFSTSAGSAIYVVHGLQHSSNTSAITSNALNTSQSSLFQHTSATSAITSNALHSSASRVINIIAATNNTGGGTASLSSNVSFSAANNFTFYTSAGNAIVGSFSQSVDTGKAGTGVTTAGGVGLSATLNTNGLSISIPSWLTTAMASNRGTDFVQANAVFNGTNASGTIASNAISVSVAAQSVQTLGLYASSQTTGQSSSSTVDARSLSIRGAGIVSVGLSGGEFIISATGGAGGLTNINLSAGTTSNNLSAFTLSNANGVSFGLNGSVVTATVQTNYLTTAALSSQTNAFSLGGNTGTTNSSVLSNGGYVIAGGSNVTLSMSNNSLSIHAATNALTSQSNQNVTAANGGFAFQTLSFSNVNGISFGTSAGSAITASHNALTTARASNDAVGLNTANTNVTWTVNSSGISINAAGYAGTGTTFNGANISGSFTLNSNGLQASMSVAAPGAAAENNNHNLLGANTAGNTTASGSTIGLSGINLTLSGTNNSVINISAPATSSLSATGLVSISTNGSTISIGVPGPYTYSGFNPYDDRIKVFTSIGQASLMLDPQYFPNIQFDRLVLPLNNTNSSNSSGSHTLSFWLGIYTLNAATLSLLTSASSSTGVTHSGTAGSYSLYSGMRLFTIPITATLTEGQYWIGFISRTTSGGANGSYSFLGISQLASNFLGHFGSSHNTTYQYTKGQGIYNTTTLGMPASIGFNQIRGSDNGLFRFPAMMFASSTV